VSVCATRDSTDARLKKVKLRDSVIDLASLGHRASGGQGLENRKEGCVASRGGLFLESIRIVNDAIISVSIRDQGML